jgi:hypothetical protein
LTRRGARRRSRRRLWRSDRHWSSSCRFWLLIPLGSWAHVRHDSRTRFLPRSWVDAGCLTTQSKVTHTVYGGLHAEVTRRPHLSPQIAKAAFSSGEQPAPPLRPSATVRGAVAPPGLQGGQVTKGACTRSPGVRGSSGGSQGRHNPFERYLIAELDAMLQPNLKSSIEPSRPRLTGAGASSSPHLRDSAPVPAAAKAAALRWSTMQRRDPRDLHDAVRATHPTQRGGGAVRQPGCTECFARAHCVVGLRGQPCMRHLNTCLGLWGLVAGRPGCL